MTSRSKTRRVRLGTAFAALAVGLGTVAASAPAAAQSSRSYRPSQEVQLSVGEGQMVRLPRNVADVWTSNPGVADVHVELPECAWSLLQYGSRTVRHEVPEDRLAAHRER